MFYTIERREQVCCRTLLTLSLLIWQCCLSAMWHGNLFEYCNVLHQLTGSGRPSNSLFGNKETAAVPFTIMQNRWCHVEQLKARAPRITKNEDQLSVYDFQLLLLLHFENGKFILKMYSINKQPHFLSLSTSKFHNESICLHRNCVLPFRNFTQSQSMCSLCTVLHKIYHWGHPVVI